MSKNIIICCDGTGNEIKENQSNVLKFFRLLEKSDEQVAFYDPGVGTISNSGPWSRFNNKAKGVFGLATGYGMDLNILEAYRFLVRNYQPGDNIYLLGFSRGAYTIRVLAGFIYMVGLLRQEQENLSSYALTAYKQTGEKDNLSIAERVQKVLDTRRIPIKFMGCWDTVGSVIVPRPDRAFIPSLQKLPFTQENPCVQIFRHAIAIDERRRMFRINRWQEPQKFQFDPKDKNTQAISQDIRQVWFSGVHADIGGGYPEDESAVAKIPLKWMVDEAALHGVIFDRDMIDRLVLGKPSTIDTRNYVGPDPVSGLHNSMNFFWQILEWIPKMIKHIDWPGRPSFIGWYLPKCEPRYIPDKSNIHDSVITRVNADGSSSGYKPVNLPMHAVSTIE